MLGPVAFSLCLRPSLHFIPLDAAAGAFQLPACGHVVTGRGAACGGRRQGLKVNYVAIGRVGKPGGDPPVSPGPVRVWLSRVRSSAAAVARPRANSKPPATRQPLAGLGLRAGSGTCWAAVGLSGPEARATCRGCGRWSQGAPGQGGLSPSVPLGEQVSFASPERARSTPRLPWQRTASNSRCFSNGARWYQ